MMDYPRGINGDYSHIVDERDLRRAKLWDVAESFPDEAAFKDGDLLGYYTAKENQWLKLFFSGNKFTKDHVIEIASQCSSVSDMKVRNYAAWSIMKRNRWDNDVVYSGGGKRPSWSKDRCRDEASKYKSRSEFAASHQYAYNISRTNGWLDEFFPVNGNTPAAEFTYDQFIEYLKLGSIRDMALGQRRLFDHAIDQGWVDRVFKDMLGLSLKEAILA